MCHPPCVATLESEQLGASHIEDLPSVIPHGCIFRTIRANQMWPQLLLVLDHGREPILGTDTSVEAQTLAECVVTYLACLGIMYSIHPPLLLDFQILLVVEE